MSLEEFETNSTSFENYLAREAGEEVPEAPAAEAEGQAEEIEAAEAEADEQELEAAEETETDGDESEEEPEESEQPEEETEYIEFALDNGEQVRLTPDEFRHHYLRQQDYTKKTQALADERRKMDEDRQRYDAMFQQRMQQLENLMQNEEPIDWEAKFRDDPLEAPLEYHKWQEREKAKQNLVMQNQQYAAQRREQHLAEQGAMLPDLIPHWAGKPEVQQTETAELKNALIADGFDPNDVGSIADARLVKWLLAGHRQLKLEQTAHKVVKKKVAGKPRVVKPGPAPKKPSQRAKSKSKLDAARKSNSNEDWTAVFEELLD